MNVSPSHRIRLNVRANAIPLNAKETIRGSPSPWNELATMPKQVADNVRRLHDSTPVKAEDITDYLTSTSMIDVIFVAVRKEKTDLHSIKRV